MVAINLAGDMRPVERQKSDRPSKVEMTLYSSGEIASNLSWNMVTGFLLFYYTDIVKIPVSPLVWLFFLTKILDAFIDLGVGAMVDRTRTRWGHARPYLLFGALPFGVMCTLVFCVPDIGTSAKVVYAFVTYGLLGLCYSVVYVPFAALQPLLSSDGKDHIFMGGLRSVGTSIASILVYSLTQPVVAMTGGGRIGFAVAAAIFSAGSVAIYIIVFKSTRERVVATTEAPSVREAVKRIVHNRVWLGAFLLMLINFGRVVSLVSILPYFSKVILGDAALLGLFLSAQSGAVLFGSLIASPLMSRIGVIRGNFSGLILTAAMFLVIGMLQEHVYLSLAAFAVASISIGIFNSTAFAGCSNAANHQEKLFGSRDEGLLASGLSFGQKVGGALGTALIALLLSQAHYSPDQTTPEVVSAVKFGFYGVQLLLLALHVPAILLLRSSEMD